MLRQTIIAAALLGGFAASAYGETYEYQVKTGTLSYSFFNLSPDTWTLDSYGPTPNLDVQVRSSPANILAWPPAPTPIPTMQCNWAQGEGHGGWKGCQSPVTSQTTNPPNFFNYWHFDTPPGTDCNASNSSQYTWVKDNYIFYAPEKGANLGAGDLPLNYASEMSTVETGMKHHATQETTGFRNALNAPAVASSWTLSNSSGARIVFAGMASATNMFISGNYYPTTTGSAKYPNCVSMYGINPIAAINPIAPLFTNQNQVVTVQDFNGNVFSTSVWKNYGAGLVGATQAINYNSSDNTQTGGMWSGMDDMSMGNLAVNSLNMSMFPLNLANYVQANGPHTFRNPGGFEFTPTTTSIYGAHFTLAIGDPFLVSSFDAKILWYLVINNQYAFGEESLTPSDLKNLKQIVVPDSGDGVFYATSTPAQYAAWLLESPGIARDVVNNLNVAASKPITKETIWGKLIHNAFKFVGDALVPAAMVVGGPAASATVKYVDGIFGPVVANTVANLACKNPDCTVTESPPPPQSTTGPPTSNQTYSSSNLLGNLLASTVVQAEMNNDLFGTCDSSGTCSNDSTTACASDDDCAGNPSNFALYSNYPIESESLCNSIKIQANLIYGTCSGVQTGDQDPSVQSYDNVLSTYPGSQSNTKINLWNAILTGMEITTVQDASAPNNGYMTLSNPIGPAFSPPIQLVDLTGGSGTSVASVNTAFHSATGMVSLISFAFNGALPEGDPRTTAPTGTPNLDSVVTTQPMAESGIQFAAPVYGSGYTYDPSTGVMQVTEYQGGASTSGPPSVWNSYPLANGPQTIDMTNCKEDSDVTIALDADPDNTTPAGASGTLYCGKRVPISASQPAPASRPSLVMVVASGDGSSSAGQWGDYIDPNTCPGTCEGLVSYDASSGTLTVQGYATGSPSASTPHGFYNGPQSIDVTQCAQDSLVTLTLYPIGTPPTDTAYGYLTCQSPPTLPYAACTRDPLATGGLIAFITNAPDDQGNGATFELACACIPEYLDNISSYPLGGVSVGATSEGINPTGTPDPTNGNVIYSVSAPGPGRFCLID